MIYEVVPRTIVVRERVHLHRRRDFGRFEMNETWREVDQDGNTIIHMVEYEYGDEAVHTCDDQCPQCMFDGRLKTPQDYGKTLQEIKDENNGELPLDWMDKIKPKDKDYLIGLVMDKSENQIVSHYWRRRQEELYDCLGGNCHNDCDTDAEIEENNLNN